MTVSRTKEGNRGFLIELNCSFDDCAWNTQFRWQTNGPIDSPLIRFFAHLIKLFAHLIKLNQWAHWFTIDSDWISRGGTVGGVGSGRVRRFFVDLRSKSPLFCRLKLIFVTILHSTADSMGTLLASVVSTILNVFRPFPVFKTYKTKELHRFHLPKWARWFTMAQLKWQSNGPIDSPLRNLSGKPMDPLIHHCAI